MKRFRTENNGQKHELNGTYNTNYPPDADLESVLVYESIDQNYIDHGSSIPYDEPFYYGYKECANKNIRYRRCPRWL